MFRLFAFEGHKAIRNLAFWIIFGVMLIVGFWFSGMMFEKLPDVLGSAYGMQYALEQPISRGEYVFLRTISDVSFTAWLSVIAGAMLIGLEFSNAPCRRKKQEQHRKICTSLYVLKAADPG